jgi:hypothetical protein
MTGSLGAFGLGIRADMTEQPAFAALWQPVKTTPGWSQEEAAGGAMVFVSRMKSLEKFSGDRKPLA